MYRVRIKGKVDINMSIGAKKVRFINDQSCHSGDLQAF